MEYLREKAKHLGGTVQGLAADLPGDRDSRRKGRMRQDGGKAGLRV